MALRNALIAGVAVAGIAVAGCGGSGTKTVTVAQTTTTTTTSSSGSAHYDANTGCLYGADGSIVSCSDPNASTTDTTTTDTTPSNVIQAGVGTSLKLDSLSARVENVSIEPSFSSDTGTSTAKGKYVVVSLKVTNRANGPQTFDSSGDETTLVLANQKSYSEAFEAENGQDQASCVWNSNAIQPDQSAVCNVDFDIPAHVAASFAHLGVLNFGDDTGSYDGSQQLGSIDLGNLA